jgi:Flp pilus assembly pilin Flp
MRREREIRELGAGYLEYVLIVSLVAIALVGATRFFQAQIESMFTCAIEEIGNSNPYVVEDP